MNPLDKKRKSRAPFPPLQKFLTEKHLTDALQLLERFGHYGESALTIIRLTQSLQKGDS